MDETFERYLAWRDQAAAVAHAYRRWGAAPNGGRGAAFAFYCAAVDQGQAAAAEYLQYAERLARSASIV